VTARAEPPQEDAPFGSPQVAAAFARYPKHLRPRLLRLRRLVLETATATEGVGALEETLKWGQPSYLPSVSRSGSTIRIDQVKSEASQYAIYFNCRTDLVARFRELYPDTFTFGGDRSIIFGAEHSVDESALRHCISLALTYHLPKRGRGNQERSTGAVQKALR
jgi:hypothetical protein